MTRAPPHPGKTRTTHCSIESEEDMRHLRVALGALVAGLVALALFALPTSAVADDSGSGSGSKDPKSAATVGIRTATAQGGDDRGVFDYEVLPRGVVRDWVAVSNFRYQPITVRLFAKDATTSPDSAFDVQASADAPKDIGGWISLKKNKLTIPPRTEIVVPFQLGVPYNAEPGDHAGAIVVSLLAKEPKPSGGTIVVDHRVGMRVHLRVPGDLKPALEVEKLKVSWNGAGSALGRGDATVTYQVRNTGNLRLDVSGNLALTRVLGLPSTTASVPLVKDLLPGGTTRITQVVRDVLGTGPMKAKVTLHGVPVDPALKAKAVDVTEIKAFPALPWLLIAIAIGLLLLLGTGGWFDRRRRKQRKARLEAQRAEELEAQELAKHRLTVRAALASVAAGIVAALVLAHAGPAGAADGDQWKATISKKSGAAIEAFDINTSGGCPKPATNMVGFAYGAGFPEEGAVVVSNTGPVDNEQGFTAAILDNMIGLMATQPHPQQLHGTYKFVIRCIKAEWPDRSYGEYVAAIKFDDPGHWRALPPLTQKKGPVVQIPTTGPNGEPKTSDHDAQGGPQAAPGSDGASPGATGEDDSTAAGRAGALIDDSAQDSGSGPSWVLLGGGIAIAVLSLLLAFGKQIPGPWRRA